MHKECAKKLVHLLSNLWRDPDLDLGPAISSTLAIYFDLVLRFNQYRGWPCAVCMLARKYNPVGYLIAIMDFVAVPQEKLDVGIGLPLQLRSLEEGSETAAIRFLSSDSVQEVVVGIVIAGTGTSLDVERKHAWSKRFEGSRLTHVGTASRNQMLAR